MLCCLFYMFFPHLGYQKCGMEKYFTDVLRKMVLVQTLELVYDTSVKGQQ